MRLATGSTVVATRKVVVPYISIRSPGEAASTLTASAQASMVPVMTGIPARRPGTSRVIALCTVPAASLAQRSSGSSRPGPTRSAHSGCHVWWRRLYIGADWLALTWSSTYSPVRRKARYEAGMNSRRARA